MSWLPHARGAQLALGDPPLPPRLPALGRRVGRGSWAVAGVVTAVRSVRTLGSYVFLEIAW